MKKPTFDQVVAHMNRGLPWVFGDGTLAQVSHDDYDRLLRQQLAVTPAATRKASPPRPPPSQIAAQVARLGYAHLCVRGEITDGLGAEFEECMAEVLETPAHALLLSVDSNGGLCHEGDKIIKSLQLFENRVGPVVAYMRQASSMASVVAAACTYVVADPTAKMFFHRVQNTSPMYGNYLERMHNRVFETAGSLLGEGAFDQLAEVERTLYADDLLEFALVDEIGDAKRAKTVVTNCRHNTFTRSQLGYWEKERTVRQLLRKKR